MTSWNYECKRCFAVHGGGLQAFLLTPQGQRFPGSDDKARFPGRQDPCGYSGAPGGVVEETRPLQLKATVCQFLWHSSIRLWHFI
jgi:hypothetical protein